MFARRPALLFLLTGLLAGAAALSALGGAAATIDDGTTPPPEPGDTTPPPPKPYCAPYDASVAPPNSVIGILNVGGVPAAPGTPVQLLFDGIPGPGRAVRVAGGYRVDYIVSYPACANSIGAAIWIAVNGQVYDTGTHVGDPGTVPLLRVDLYVPPAGFVPPAQFAPPPPGPILLTGP